MSSDDTLYSARFQFTTLIERGRDNLIKCSVYRDGSLVAPSSGAITIYNGDGSAVVSAAAITVVSSIATYTVANATTTSLSLDDDWRVEWSLAMPDSVTHVFRNDAALVRRALYQVVTDADLYRRVSSLDPTGNTPLSSLSSFQAPRDEAWTAIQHRLSQQGNRPNLVISPSALREAHLLLTLTMIFEDFSTRLNEAYENRADAYRRQYDQEWRRLKFKYDVDDDGNNDDANKRRGAQSILWLGSGGRTRRTR